jgi:hypothetical protein
MKINEVLQPRHKEEFASAHYRVSVDTKRVTPAMLFSPAYWESNTVLKKGDIIRCVAEDGSYAFDLIVTSQKLDASKSVKNIVTVAMFPKLTDEVIMAAEGLAYADAVDVPVVQEPEKPVEPVVVSKPAFDSNVSFAKRKEIAKRQKLVDKRAEIEARNKARTAERIAAESAA